jgi:hypothetical protein
MIRLAFANDGRGHNVFDYKADDVVVDDAMVNTVRDMRMLTFGEEERNVPWAAQWRAEFRYGDYLDNLHNRLVTTNRLHMTMERIVGCILGRPDSWYDVWRMGVGTKGWEDMLLRVKEYEERYRSWFKWKLWNETGDLGAAGDEGRASGGGGVAKRGGSGGGEGGAACKTLWWCPGCTQSNPTSSSVCSACKKHRKSAPDVVIIPDDSESDSDAHEQGKVKKLSKVFESPVFLSKSFEEVSIFFYFYRIFNHIAKAYLI